MRQYCRYCAHLVTGNGIWCSEHRVEVSEAYAKTTNHCKDFDLCEIDAFGENPNPYKPRPDTKKGRDMTALSDHLEEQIGLFGGDHDGG